MSLTQWCQWADIECALCLLVLLVAVVAILLALQAHRRVLCDITWCVRSHRSAVRSGSFARGGLLVAPPWRSAACVACLLLILRWIKLVDLRSLEGRRVCNSLVEDGLLASLHRFIIVAQVVWVDLSSLDLGVTGAYYEGRFSRVSRRAIVSIHHHWVWLLHDLRVIIHLIGGSGHWIHVCRRILGCDSRDAHRASLTLALAHLLLA